MQNVKSFNTSGMVIREVVVTVKRDASNAQKITQSLTAHVKEI